VKKFPVGAPIVFLLVFLISNFTGIAVDSMRQDHRREKYTYTAFPLIHGTRGDQETIEVVIMTSFDRVLYTSYTVSEKGAERKIIQTNGDGNFISATKEVIDRSGDRKKEYVIWREGGKAYSTRGASQNETARTFDLPSDMELAVDASLLMKMRSISFDGGKPHKVYMVDFSQIAVSVTVSETGSETVYVPAGVFDCYRIEVSVDLPIVKPKITFWLTKDHPHFLVKHVGMAGPFTPFYETFLESAELHQRSK
jgi:hypothetical protein